MKLVASIFKIFFTYVQLRIIAYIIMNTSNKYHMHSPPSI